MVQELRRAKGESGLHNVGYRHVDGQVFPAQITGSTALATPGVPTVTPQGAAGTTTYSYRIVARAGNGKTLASTAGTTATGNATLDGTNFNRIVPAIVTGATAYEIYGRIGGSEGLLGVISAAASPFQFDDKGNTITGAPGAAPPAAANAFRYNIRVPALRQGPSGGTNWIKSNVSIAPTPGTTDALVI